MSHHLNRDDLLSLEAYATQRNAFRTRVMAHKKVRKVLLGEHLSLLFEDQLTIQYQVQEMLRAERIFEAAGIDEELASYNPLIPDGSNLKATMLIEYTDVAERRAALARLRGIENQIEIQVDGHRPTVAIADEDLPRSNQDKTSAVHFLRFEFDAAMLRDWRGDARISLRSSHPAMPVETLLDDATRQALAADFD